MAFFAKKRSSPSNREQGDLVHDSSKKPLAIKCHSLSWRLILPVPITIALVTIAIWLVVPTMVADNARTEAIRQGQQIADQFKTIRGNSTKNVIKKVVKSRALKPHVQPQDGSERCPASRHVHP